MKSKGADDQQRRTPFFSHTNPEVPACYQSFPVQRFAIVGPPSSKELVKTVYNVLEGLMLRKNPRKHKHLILTGRMV